MEETHSEGDDIVQATPALDIVIEGEEADVWQGGTSWGGKLRSL